MTDKQNKTIYDLCRTPKILHYILENPKERIIIVGDIHGCYEEFMDLLYQCVYDPDHDTLILVGDLCMKGPKSLETIQFCCKNKILSVRGNVDENTLRNYELLKTKDPLYKEDWLEYEFLKHLTDDEINYLYELPYTITIPKINSMVVHAGLMPNKPLEEQNLDDLIRMRNIYENNGVLKADVGQTKGDAWITYWKGSSHIYFGHNAERGLQFGEYATGLDSACCYGKFLTGIIINGSNKKIVSVAKKT
ncbi:MAG: hypothetical protein Satyrvirus6_18 [Satyrvirus sp.]|uniref:Calcineurin-like phosphoesterase domain-containing protein n=1 Tax=Satyrvirus sp. TaxID=2487771 RepID=A0A3G5AD92_9VIRU|nr:MAG: hypothetical protein Satyrvirus6_18 [Satyrvirus sp.]